VLGWRGRTTHPEVIVLIRKLPYVAHYGAVMAGLGGGSSNAPTQLAPEIRFPQNGQELYVFTEP
jgi:hypothetical protein